MWSQIKSHLTLSTFTCIGIFTTGIVAHELCESLVGEPDHWFAIITGLIASVSFLMLWLSHLRKSTIIEHHAKHDTLTGLCNRFEFTTQFNKLLNLGHPFQLLVIDLNKFKIVNDTYGHDAGDNLLKQLAHILSGVANKTDTVSRIGGDEFAILLPGQDRAETVIHRIYQCLAEPMLIDDHILHVDVACGTCTFSDEHNSVVKMMRYADEGMFRNKNYPNRTERRSKRSKRIQA